MKKLMALVLLLVVLLSPALAFAGSATDAALGLGAFAVLNQILGGVGIFGAFARPAPVYAAPAPAYVAPPPVVLAPAPRVVVVPAPVYVAPAPVVVRPPVIVQPRVIVRPHRPVPGYHARPVVVYRHW
jgi:hypothetical protein